MALLPSRYPRQSPDSSREEVIIEYSSKCRKCVNRTWDYSSVRILGPKSDNKSHDVIPADWSHPKLVLGHHL